MKCRQHCVNQSPSLCLFSTRFLYSFLQVNLKGISIQRLILSKLLASLFVLFLSCVRFQYCVFFTKLFFFSLLLMELLFWRFLFFSAEFLGLTATLKLYLRKIIFPLAFVPNALICLCSFWWLPLKVLYTWQILFMIRWLNTEEIHCSELLELKFPWWLWIEMCCTFV